jgi:predicted transcriptional regulator
MAITLTVKLDTEVMRKLRDIAMRDDRSLSWLGQRAVEQFIERQEAQQPAAKPAKGRAA